MERPLGLLIAEQPDIEVSWLNIPTGEEKPAEALSRGAAEGIIRPFSPLHLPTGLPNRKLFCERLDHLLRFRIEQDHTTVIVFNIEQLGNINDTHGRHVGDILLQCVADRLGRRFGDNLAYYGSGVFAAVFDERRQLREAVGHSATAVFGQPFAIGGCPMPVTVKCGLARFPVDGQDAGALLHHAERALDKLREHHQKSPRAMPRANGEILDALGCEDSDGYLQSPALSAEEIEFLIAARSSDP
jgi:diguanylate cyclase (GGDEF)-like protein